MKRFVTKNKLIFEENSKKPYSGIFEEFWPSGQILRRGAFKDGKKDGIWEKYRNTGSLVKKVAWLNNNQHGIYEDYWPNGNIQRKGQYENGKDVGVWIIFNQLLIHQEQYICQPLYL